MTDSRPPMEELLDSPVPRRRQGNQPIRTFAVAGSALALVVLVVALNRTPSGSDTALPTNSTTGSSTTVTTLPVVTDAEPTSRRYGRVAFDPNTRTVLVVGGQLVTEERRWSEPDDRAWLFDTRSHLWRQVNEAHLPIGLAGLALISIPDRGFVTIGGSEGIVNLNCPTHTGIPSPLFCADQPTNVQMLFDPATGSSRPFPAGNPPTPRSGHAAVYHPGADRVVLFGGLSEQELPDHLHGVHLGDTWVLDPMETTWEHIDSPVAPSPRAWHAMTYSDETGLIYLFGGVSTSRTNADAELWAFDIQSGQWSVVEPASDDRPDPRWQHALVYDSLSRRLFAIGGERRTGCSDGVWSFDTQTATWAIEPQLGAGCAASATSIGSGQVFLSSGIHGIFDIASGEWVAVWGMG